MWKTSKVKLEDRILSGFKNTGLFPFNLEIIRSFAYNKSEAVDRPLEDRQKQYLADFDAFLMAEASMGRLNDVEIQNVRHAQKDALQGMLELYVRP